MKEKILKTKKVTINDLSNTIDNLAFMVAKGFDGVHKEIREVKVRLGSVEDRLGNVEERLGKVEEKLGRVDDNLNTTRMDVLGIGDNFVSRHDFNQHLIRFDLLEQRVKAKK